MDEQRRAFEVIRWTQAELPAGLDTLVTEALASGHAWAAHFLPAWQEGPFTGPGEALLLAREGERPLAMAVISADPFTEDAVTGRLRFIYVRHDARRRGIAERLVRECLALAAGHWQRLRLHTDNAVAARLYERYGFRPSAEDPRATHVMTLPGAGRKLSNRA